MTKEKIDKIIDKVIKKASEEEQYYGLAMDVISSGPASSFKILFRLLDRVNEVKDRGIRYNIYFFFMLALHGGCRFKDSQLKLIYRRVFFNQELLEFYLLNTCTPRSNLDEMNRLIGKEPQCKKSLNKLIMKKRRDIFKLSDVIMAFRHNLSDNTVDYILNILLKYVDKFLIDDFNLLDFLNSNRKFTPRQQKKIDAINILRAMEDN
jgi:hypothetical protein